MSRSQNKPFIRSAEMSELTRPNLLYQLNVSRRRDNTVLANRLNAMYQVCEMEHWAERKGKACVISFWLIHMVWISEIRTLLYKQRYSVLQITFLCVFLRKCFFFAVSSIFSVLLTDIFYGNNFFNTLNFSAYQISGVEVSFSFFPSNRLCHHGEFRGKNWANDRKNAATYQAPFLIENRHDILFSKQVLADNCFKATCARECNVIWGEILESLAKVNIVIQPRNTKQKLIRMMAQLKIMLHEDVDRPNNFALSKRQLG